MRMKLAYERGNDRYASEEMALDESGEAQNEAKAETKKQAGGRLAM